MLTTKQTEKISAFVQFMIIALVLIFLSSDVYAQTGVSGSLKKFETMLIQWSNYIFVMVIVYGIIVVVIGFATSSPNATRNLVYLAIACIVWYGFDTLVTDIAEGVGSSSSGGGFTSK